MGWESCEFQLCNVLWTVYVQILSPFIYYKSVVQVILQRSFACLFLWVGWGGWLWKKQGRLLHNRALSTSIAQMTCTLYCPWTPWHGLSLRFRSSTRRILVQTSILPFKYYHELIWKLTLNICFDLHCIVYIMHRYSKKQRGFVSLIIRENLLTTITHCQLWLTGYFQTLC